MNAIVPLNVAAIRVNAIDNSNIVIQFKGRTAVFYRSDAFRSRSSTHSGVSRRQATMCLRRVK